MTNDNDTLGELSIILINYQQDGAASESSSSREGIVRKFSCQDIGHWSIDFGHWIFELRHWALEFGHWI